MNKKRTNKQSGFTIMEIMIVIAIKRDARPVELIRAYGFSGDSRSIVEIEARTVPLNLETQATLYAKNHVVSNGSVDVDGNDHGTCGATEPPKAPIYTYPTGTTTTLNGSSNTMERHSTESRFRRY